MHWSTPRAYKIYWKTQKAISSIPCHHVLVRLPQNNGFPRLVSSLLQTCTLITSPRNV